MLLAILRGHKIHGYSGLVFSRPDAPGSRMRRWLHHNESRAVCEYADAGTSPRILMIASHCRI
jgi:hypothetical protein